MPEEELTLTEQGRIAEQFVTGLLERFGVAASTEVVPIDDETIEIRVEGPELGLLIGPKGQTLQAVQEMTRTVVQRRSVARTGRILVDVAGYRVKRRQALERFTQQVAEDVRATGVQRVLEPMSAPDRKIVHDTANDLAGVRTISEGEEPRRRVVILPDGSDARTDGQRSWTTTAVRTTSPDPDRARPAGSGAQAHLSPGSATSPSRLSPRAGLRRSQPGRP